MARVQKDTVSYFPHDANSCAGDTLTVLQSRFGNDGYAFWFKLLEKLCSTDGHVIDCSNTTKWQLLLAKTGVNEITGVEMMNLLVEMQAIDKELWASKLIWCQKLVDNVSDVYKNRRREIPQKPLTTDDKPITTDNNPITTGLSTQSKVKQSRVNNIYSVFFIKFWEEYPIKIGKDKAYKVFKGIKPDKKLLDSMIVAIVKQKEWREHNNGFTPEWKHPATWLNSGCWNDEIPEVNNAKIKGIRSSSRGLPDRDKYTEPYSD